MTVMTSVTNMPWTFAVVFFAIFALLLISGAIWLWSQGPSHRHK
jgi:predicted small integral membrane protein